MPALSTFMTCSYLRIQEGGYKALYKGVTPTAIRALPAYGASFLGYEKTVEFIEWRRLTQEERDEERERDRERIFKSKQ